MRVLFFAVLLGGCVAIELQALKPAYADVTRPRWQSVGVFLGGGLLAGVLACAATLLAGVSGLLGLAGFVFLLGVNAVVLARHERRGERRQDDNSTVR